MIKTLKYLLMRRCQVRKVIQLILVSKTKMKKQTHLLVHLHTYLLNYNRQKSNNKKRAIKMYLIIKRAQYQISILNNLRLLHIQQMNFFKNHKKMRIVTKRMIMMMMMFYHHHLLHLHIKNPISSHNKLNKDRKKMFLTMIIINKNNN